VDDEDQGGAGAPATTDPQGQSPAEEPPAQQDDAPDRRLVHGLGGAGCLVMILAAAAAIALLSTGNFLAGVAGILIIAVAIGVGLWLYSVASLGKK
jgi:hypothetical protein